MRLKPLVVSVAVLAVLSAIVYVARRPGPPPSKDARLNQPLLAPSVVEKAAKLQIGDAGKTVTLVRQADGTWKNTSYHDLPADLAKLGGFIGNLTDAKLQRLVTSNAERLARLEFKDTKVTLLDASDKALWTVTLGKSAELGGGRFVRFDDEPKAYLTALNAWIDADAKNWANAELLNVKPEDVTKVEIAFPADAAAKQPAATVTLTRAAKDAPWKSEATPAHQQVKTATVSSLLSSAGTIRFTDTTDLNDPNAAAAKANSRSVKLTTFDGKTYTVTMGRKPEEKKLKPPVPSTDGKTGPASMGSVADLTKKDSADKDGEKKVEEPKPVTPEFETIPAGPVFVFISSSDASAPINALMQKRAFQIGDYTFTGLPQKPEELFEPAPAPAPAAKPGTTDTKTEPAPKK